MRLFNPFDPRTWSFPRTVSAAKAPTELLTLDALEKAHRGARSDGSSAAVVRMVVGGNEVLAVSHRRSEAELRASMQQRGASSTAEQRLAEVEHFLHEGREAELDRMAAFLRERK